MTRSLRQVAAPSEREPAMPANLPPVRMGLLAKLNLLTVGLDPLHRRRDAGFYLWQQLRDEASGLSAQGRTVATMLAELSERGLQADDRAAINAVLDSLPPEGDIAYVAVLDSARNQVAERRFGRLVRGTERCPRRACPAARPRSRSRPPTCGCRGSASSTSSRRCGARRRRSPRCRRNPADDAGTHLATAALSGGGPVGYIRVGMTFERQQAQFRKLLVGGTTLAALLVLLAVASAILLTERLVSPMRRLVRASSAVGAGRLDVHVPPSSSDELGHLTHAFNHMTQRLAVSQSEVEDYQRTLEAKVAQRTRELEVATAQAIKLAQHDILTGLPNRSLLNHRLKQIIAQAQRDGTHVACVFLDFDHFKRINDTLGHEAGDQLLQAVAQRLTHAVRETDTVARLGGDEFVLVLPGLDPAHATFETMTVLARVRESFLAPFRLSDQVPTLTCSIGISMYPLDAGDPVTLIKQADTAMYASKGAGRNAYRFFTADMNASVQQRLQLETDMRRGLIGNEFFLVYQPQIDLRSGAHDGRRGAGALARPRPRRRHARGLHPGRRGIGDDPPAGLARAARSLSPGERLAPRRHAAAAFGQPLGPAAPARRLAGRGRGGADVVRPAAALPRPRDHRERDHLAPRAAVATLVKLKQRGISITVDDFGTGYSSLSYLARLPIQSLKIDQRFVRGLDRNKSDETITQAIIALSHSLGLRVIAEGVETAAQFAFLKSLGCEEAQGYLISHPMEEPDFVIWWALQDREANINGLQHDMWPTAH